MAAIESELAIVTGDLSAYQIVAHFLDCGPAAIVDARLKVRDTPLKRRDLTDFFHKFRMWDQTLDRILYIF